LHTRSAAVDGDFPQQLQFTADIPGDARPHHSQRSDREFEFRRPGLFGILLLADEINRSTPSAIGLLEAMNEMQVTIDGRSYPLSPPFAGCRTQNPVEHHGTYPLPESQLDRFLLRLRIGIRPRGRARDPATVQQSADPLGPVLGVADLLHLQEAAQQYSGRRRCRLHASIVARTRD
jgi:MoxR-like ATPase